MRKQDQLNQLISTLTKAEQRYFKLFASMQSGNKQFMGLFEELKKSGSYEAELLAKKLKISERNLVHTKRYLQQVLLDSLRLYHQDSFMLVSLQNQWQEARILQARKLPAMAFELNEKVLKRATELELFHIKQMALQQKYNLLVFLDRVPEAREVAYNLSMVVKQMDEVQQIMICNNAFSEAAGGLDAPKRLKQMAELPIFKSKPANFNSQSARLLWHEMKQFYYSYASRNVKAVIYHNLARIRIFEAYPQMIHTLPHNYISALLYLSNSYGDLHKYDEGLFYARKLEAETDGSRKEIPLNMASYANLMAKAGQLYLLCYTARFDEALRMGAASYNRKNELLQDHFIFTLHHYALALFYTGKYEKARKIAEEIQGLNPEIMAQEQFSCKFLLMMIQHAVGNTQLIPHFAHSAISWAKRHNLKAPGTKEIVSAVKEFSKLTSEKDRQKFFHELKIAVDKKKFKGYERTLMLRNWVDANLVKD